MDALTPRGGLQRLAPVARISAPSPAAEIEAAADPHDVAMIAAGWLDASTVTADEGTLAATYAGELGEVLDDMITDESELAEETRTHLVSLEEQAEGWLIAGWPVDADDPHHAPHRMQPVIVEDEAVREEREELYAVPSFADWLHLD